MNEKKRLSILIEDKMKKEWLKFAEKKGISTISKLIRESVQFYIEFNSTFTNINNIHQIIHNLNEPLTSIKGFSEILMNSYKTELSLDALLTIKHIFDQSEILEKRIERLSFKKSEELKDDLVLIIDDDPLTLEVLFNFFHRKGFSCKKAINATQAIEFLDNINPKFVLLDIWLPDINGYELCKKIKSNKKTSNLKIYFITAIPENEVIKRIEDTGADGYFTKPFNLSEFEILIQ